MSFSLFISNEIEKSEDYSQCIFRLKREDVGLRLTLNLIIPDRFEEDRKSISKNQFSTIKGFFYNHEIVTENCGWQQASAILNQRLLSYAVSETLPNGFLAANRIFIAPLIAAYVSHSPYLCAIARAWSLGNWKSPSKGSSCVDDKTELLSLVCSPFYKELFEFSQKSTNDIMKFMREH